MKKIFQVATAVGIIAAIYVLHHSSFALANEIVISREDGGSNITDLGYDIKVNPKSKLRREWIVLNDPLSPIEIKKKTGIDTNYSRRRYNFISDGGIIAKDNLTAYKLVFVLFDVFGKRMNSLAKTEIRDIGKGGSDNFSRDSSWYATENNVRNFLVSVVFVLSVRRREGGVWQANLKKIQGTLDKIGFQVAADKLVIESKK